MFHPGFLVYEVNGSKDIVAFVVIALIDALHIHFPVIDFIRKGFLQQELDSRSLMGLRSIAS